MDPIRDIAAAIVASATDDPDSANIKQGVVTSVNADLTANVTIDSGIVNNVAFLNLLPQVGWTVWLANLGSGRWLGLGRQGLAPGWYPIDRQVRTSTGALSFTNIPQFYVDLRLKMRLRGDNANVVDEVRMRLNNISTSTYSTVSDGWVAFPANDQQNSTTTYVLLGHCDGNTSTANCFGFGEATLLEYSESSKVKGGYGQCGYSDSYATVKNTHFSNAALTPISRIDLGSTNGFANWLVGSVATLEGRIA